MSLADALGRGGRYTVDTAYAAGVACVVNTNAARAAQDELSQAAPSGRRDPNAAEHQTDAPPAFLNALQQ